MKSSCIAKSNGVGHVAFIVAKEVIWVQKILIDLSVVAEARFTMVFIGTIVEQLHSKET